MCDEIARLHTAMLYGMNVYNVATVRQRWSNEEIEDFCQRVDEIDKQVIVLILASSIAPKLLDKLALLKKMRDKLSY